MPKKEKKGKVFKAEYYDFNLVAVVILLIALDWLCFIVPALIRRW